MLRLALTDAYAALCQGEHAALARRCRPAARDARRRRPRPRLRAGAPGPTPDARRGRALTTTRHARCRLVADPPGWPSSWSRRGCSAPTRRVGRTCGPAPRRRLPRAARGSRRRVPLTPATSTRCARSTTSPRRWSRTGSGSWGSRSPDPNSKGDTFLLSPLRLSCCVGVGGALKVVVRGALMPLPPSDILPVRRGGAPCPRTYGRRPRHRVAAAGVVAAQAVIRIAEPKDPYRSPCDPERVKTPARALLRTLVVGTVLTTAWSSPAPPTRPTRRTPRPPAWPRRRATRGSRSR